MNSKIKIAVIGGTGKSGKYLVKELIKQGFQLKILIRDPDKFQIRNPLVEVVIGDVINYSSVSSLIEGCQAVISTLGMGIPASEPTIFSQATSNIVQAMNEQKIRRYIVTTGLNVDAHFDNKSPKTLFATEWMSKNYPISTANKQLELDILSNSNIDWTLVRLPLIEQTDKIEETIVSLEDCPGDKVSATDLANFLIEQLSNEAFIRKSPFIASV
ncbi:SDR family oxidoreductase [Cytophagaceae bacterium 50C-KIRBA]|uniref:SDR family oxidoreductase n=1 Tax=Aquirufa beregesia TaxID=2516556 RepID=A0ABX0EZI8_9BACT|nr:SDR family oxidoreductase [Aquirufa beregesia]NGZ45470.1 SDR family oxidoreductase [Aquirufa beregesia]